ncbi:hypothetical protein BDP81DRAFT_85382 [Colletotrichum phormii]|uniref:Uncharacterized protein n=1 Tax=Colletotrichum phormii TaxID=359342 RepID=A0AAJ0A168_9PEZI|nr:uncharacterized protein BDP81DRAFT_85382 [Colletotrichum phormii]KAK1654564.1 hypothetical protein BDP81DRAFT_85382 [Colletotrichum phormii]
MTRESRMWGTNRSSDPNGNTDPRKPSMLVAALHSNLWQALTRHPPILSMAMCENRPTTVTPCAPVACSPVTITTAEKTRPPTMPGLRLKGDPFVQRGCDNLRHHHMKCFDYPRRTSGIHYCVETELSQSFEVGYGIG